MISKKTRNKLISRLGALLLGCTLIFGLSNPTSIKAEDKKVKNVIYLIADGMNDGILTASKYYNDIQDGVLGNDKLAMDTIRSGFVKTSWANGPITDSAPAGTALATGQKTNPGVIGLNTEGNPRATILEAAEVNGLATGIIATSEITHATPGAFSAHVESRQDYNTIMKQQLYKDMEVVLGGGSEFFSETGGGKRKDGFDLTKDIKSLGYDYITTKSEMQASEANKLWGLFAPRDLAYDFDRTALNMEEQPSLAEMTSKAIEVLEKDKEGFFLMVEGSKIDWAAHANDPSGAIGDVIAFDKAVEVALNYAKENQDTIVVVTTDHGNSGFSIGNESTTSGYDDLTFEESIMKIKDFKLSIEKFNSLIKDKSDDEIKKLIKEYYGYSGITDEELKYAKEGNIKEVMKSRAKLGYTTGGHTGGDVYLGVYAPAGVTKLRGTVDNTELPKYIAKNLNLDLDIATESLYQDIKTKVESEGDTFTINKDDIDNPYVLISKDNKTLKLIINSNKVEVIMDNKKISEKTLSSTSILVNENAYGKADEIISLLKEKIDNNSNNNTPNNDNNSNKDNTSNNNNNSNKDNTSNKDNNSDKDNTSVNSNTNLDKPIKNQQLNSKLPNTGAVIGSSIFAILGIGSIGAGIFTLKKKNKK